MKMRTREREGDFTTLRIHERPLNGAVQNDEFSNVNFSLIKSKTKRSVKFRSQTQKGMTHVDLLICKSRTGLSKMIAIRTVAAVGAGKRHEGTFWGDGNSVHLVLGKCYRVHAIVRKFELYSKICAFC